MATYLYGIKNCDTVKKARQWLEQHGVEYRFHDFRVDGLDLALLHRLETSLGWEAMLNQRGTSWRKLEVTERENLTKDKALSLMLAHPTVIKRPVLERDGNTLIGFSAEHYRQALGLDA